MMQNVKNVAKEKLKLFQDNTTMPFVITTEMERAIKRFEKFLEIHEITERGWRTRLGRHPLESQSKYDGNGKLKTKA